MSILERFEQYVERRVANGRPSEHTLRSYRTQARMYLAWCAGQGLDARAATEEDVISYRQSLAEYAPATVALKLQVARTLYEALGVQPNPALGVQAPPDRTPDEERITYLSVEQVRAVLAQVEAVEDQVRRRRDRALLLTLTTFGLRAQEVRGLRLGDLRLDVGRLAVVGKGDKRRTLHLTPGTARALQDWLAVRPRGGRALFVGLTGRGALSDSGLRKIVNGYLRAAGVKIVGQACHLFRHTALTLAAKAGAARDEIRRMAGHADARTTDLYIHLAASAEHNPALAIETALGGSQ